MSEAQVLPHELLADGIEPPSCELLVIGCGNILRGDDAVGPILIRHLWSEGVPESARLVDGGTAGMDVAFQMRGAKRVVIVDAANTGAEPGTIYRVPGEELEALPPVTGLHTHSFRWDHAIAFGRWLLGPGCPTDITVFLVEAGSIDAGAELSGPVAAAMKEVIAMIRRDFVDVLDRGNATAELGDVAEITSDGYLRLTRQVSERYFPADVCGAAHDGDDLVLLPLQSQANGGLVLKQRSRSGDRSILVREVLADNIPTGHHPIRWDADRGAVVVELDRGV